MENYVHPEGPQQCLMALVGQAPGEVEVARGRPFVGPSGTLLDAKLQAAGISRHHCYVTNLVKVRPTANDFSIYWRGIHPTRELLEWRDKLLHELAGTRTNVLVALGKDALWALTGHTSIDKWRGSVLETKLPDGRTVKVVGTFHPAFALRQWDVGPIIQLDLKRALHESKFPEIRRKTRTLITSPSFEDVERFIRQAAPASEVSFDIEVSHSDIVCIGLATTPDAAISIPTTAQYWGSTSRLKEILHMIDFILSKEGTLKVGQNILFDIQYLARFFGMLPSKPWFDTMVAFHSVYLELPKGLDFMVSVYTDIPYYKDALRTWRDGEATDSLLYKYNATDACATLEVKHRLEEEIQEFGTRHTFDFLMELLEPLIFMSLKGIRVDMNMMDSLKHEFSSTVKQEEAEIKSSVGNVNLDSPAQLAELAYVKMGFKPHVSRKTGRTTVEKKALEKLSRQNPVFQKIVEIKERKKLLSTYLSQPLDPIDNRWRFSLNIAGTKTLRLSSSASVFGGTGGNIQNIPKGLRSIFIPDDGKVFTEADLKGAEAMVMAYLTDDPVQIKLFEEGKNVIAYNASLLFDTSTDHILTDREKCDTEGRPTHSMYYKAKRITHAANYMSSWMTLSEILKVPAATAKYLLQKYYDTHPQLRRYHNLISKKLRLERILVTPLGTKRVFFDRYSPSMIREAVAFVPQETVTHVANIGLTRVYSQLCHNTDIDVLAQMHDGILLQHPPDLTEFVHEQLMNLMKVELTINRRTFSIPVEIKTGHDWKNVK